jgi:hypothetical protein
MNEDLEEIKATLARLERQLKKKPGRPVIWAALGFLVLIQAVPAVTFGLISVLSHPAHGAEYSLPQTDMLAYSSSPP